MGKKLKQAAEAATKNDLSKAIKDSAQQIWLAGLGAFAKAQEEGGKVFETLVAEGMNIQKRTKAATEEKVAEVAEKVAKNKTDWTRQATQSLDKLETIFEDRVSRALGRLGVPSKGDLQDLLERVEALTAQVEKLNGGEAAAPKAKPAAKKSVSAKAAEVVEAASEAAAETVAAVAKASKPRVRKPAAKPAAEAAAETAVAESA